MASISKRVSGAWQNTSYGIRATATDTITMLPTTIYGDGTNATVSIKGNTVQSGTPTPSSPVDVVGVGELETSGEHSGEYKISISSTGQTNVYLGEVETTRKVRKAVLTGSELWYVYTAGNVHQFYTQNMVIGGVASSSAYSTITPYGMTVDSRIGDYGCFLVASGNEIAFQMYGSKADFPTQTEWKAYLAQQYAAGTPVCVWYVLANEETAVVNEPLMKIEDYADEVNNISIPTTDGANALSVDTTVQPSEVSVNYHGWHMGTVHERTAGQWD